MWNDILNLALKNGIWAVLFLGLFVFVIKDSTNREKKYQQTIKNLTEHLGVVKEIKDDVDEIKNVVFQKKVTKKRKNTSKTGKKTANKDNFDSKEENSFKSFDACLKTKIGGDDEK